MNPRFIIILNHCNYVKWSLKLIFLQSIQEKNEREEAERKKRIQLYVFILRSVAYPFNAKQPSDMSKRHLKVTKDGHDKMKAKIEVSFTVPRNVTSELILYNSFL